MQTQPQTQNNILQLLSERYTNVYCGNETFEFRIDRNFLREHAVKWHLKSETDPVKVSEITQSFIEMNTEYIGSTLYFFTQNDKLVCYDGCHRLDALMNTGINNSICCRVTTSRNMTDRMVISRLQTLGISTPTPELVTPVINQVFELYMDRYRAFYKTSQRPQKPHFNRETFFKLCNENSHRFNTRQELQDLLVQMNSESRRLYSHHLNAPARVHNKMRDANFYLFYYFNSK